VCKNRYNPTLLIDIENRQVLWDFQTETEFAHPWARQHFVCKREGRSILILLKRTGTTDPHYMYFLIYTYLYVVLKYGFAEAQLYYGC